MRIALPLAALVVFATAGAPAPDAEAARCKTLSYGYVGYTKSGTERFVRRQLDRKISAWKKDRGKPDARVGATDVDCKTFLKIGFFVEWECHAKAKVC